MLIPSLPRAGSALLSALTALLPAGAAAQEQAAATPELSVQREFLKDLSSWQLHVVQRSDQAVDKRERGVFPVGDGQVFTYLGCGRTANTMQALTGPHYQTSEVNAPKGHWGELTLDLLEGGKGVELTNQSVWRTRGVNVVITEDATARRTAGSELSLYTINWATAGTAAIYRWIEVKNRGDRARSLTLRARWERGRPNGETLTATYASKGFEAELIASRQATVSDNELSIDLGEVASGGVAKVVLALRTKGANEAYALGAIDEGTALGALDTCERQWRARLAGSVTVASDNVRLADLLEDWKVLMLVQRSEPSGAVSPMVNYRGSWVRDNTGPILAFLRYGMFDEARAILDFVYDATLVTGRLNNHVPLDLDVSKAREAEKTVHWGRVQIPNTELPAWIILQHEWYYRATWDVELIRDRWPFLAACYQAMKPDSRATLPAHGDETYLHGAFFSTWPERLSEPSYLPADTPERRARSFDSTVLYLISIAAMGEMAEDVDRLEAGPAAGPDFASRRRQAFDQRHLAFMQEVEKTFWLPDEKRFAPFLSPVNGKPHTAPYGPVNLRPQWVGFTYATGEKNRENLRNTLKALWRKDRRVGMTPTVGYAVGHLQGYLLYSLADLDDKGRHDALDALMELAGPAGEWAELYDPEGRPVGAYDREWPNRLRPWESGVNIDAIFFALNGIRYACCPGWSRKDQRLELRTPPRARWLKMKNMVHEGHVFHIYLDEVFVRDLKLEPTGRPISKMRFRVHYDHINVAAANITYVDCAINVGETLYVRYPTQRDPVIEQDVWPAEKESCWPEADGPGTYVPRTFPPLGTRTCVVTAIPGRSVVSGAYVLDIGLPLAPEQLAGFLVDGSGKRRFDRVVLDQSATLSNRATFKKPAFFENPKVVQAMKRFEELGGKLVSPGFFRSFEVVGPFPAAELDALDTALAPETPASFRAGTFSAGGKQLSWEKVDSGGGALDLRAATGGRDHFVAYASVVLESDRDRECTLKVGSDDGVRAWVNGKSVLTSKRLRTAAPDQDEVLIRLNKGENRVLFKVYNDTGGCFLFARVTDTDGVPLSGLRVR